LRIECVIIEIINQLFGEYRKALMIDDDSCHITHERYIRKSAQYITR